MSFGNFSFGAAPAAAPAAPSTGFGAAPASGGGLFGQPAASSPAPASGGLFGQPAAQKPFSGFGAPASSTSQPSTSLFGQPAQPQQSTSLFGQPAQQQQPQPQQQQQQQTSSLFGQQQPASTSLFGQQQPASSSLFGQPPPPQQQSGGLFGQQQPQQQSGGLFGGQNNSLTVSQLGQPKPTQSFGLFGQQPQQQQQQQNGQSLFGNNSLAASQQPPPPPLKPEDLPIEQRIELVKNAWDPNSPSCRFKSFFYNVVQPNEVEMYQRPPAANDDATWFAAVRANPDPSTMVPAIAVGFSDLQKRTEVQTRVAGAHYAKLQEISTRLVALQKSSHMALSLRLSRAQLLETQLSHRTLQLIKHLHLLIPSLRSSSIRRDEEVLTQRLEALVAQLEGGRGRKSESLKGRMVELWGLLGEVKSERDRDRSAAGGREGWAIVDEGAMNELATIIASQQQALQHVTKVLKEDLEAIETMRIGLGLTKGKADGRS